MGQKPRAGFFASKAAERRVEVHAGLLQRRVTEHVLHMVDRPSAVEQP
jgi:hypothetical protein